MFTANSNQNILIASRDPLWIKLADFGASKRANNTFLRTLCGTRGYLAPEMQGLLPRGMARGEQFTNALDLWSLGCIVYELLTSQIPFLELDLEVDELSGLDSSVMVNGIDMQLLYEYCQGKTDFPSEILLKSDVAEDGIEFVKSLLTANPSLRATASTALQNPWILNTGYASTWFMDLQREFGHLGVELNLGSDRAAMRQLRNADIALVLPGLTEFEPLIEESLRIGYHTAALALLRSSTWIKNSLGVRGLSERLVLDGRIEQVKTLISLMPDLASSEQLLLGVGGRRIDTQINDRASLQAAVEFGGTALVNLLLDNEPDVDRISNDGQTGLHQETVSGNVKVAKLFMESINSKSKSLRAIHRETTSRIVKASKPLIESMSNVHSISNDGQTALQLAPASGNVDMATLLLTSGFNINSRSNDGQTALHRAVASGDFELVKLLLDNQADVTIKSSNGQTVFHIAELCENANIEQLFWYNQYNVNAISKTFWTGWWGILSPASELCIEAGCGHSDRVQLLLNSGVKINTVSRDGRTALEAASGNGQIDMVQFLLNKGAKINTNPPWVVGRTALRSAAGAGHLEVVKLLLANRADINAESGDGRTALQAAARHGHFNVVKLLVENDADINANPSWVVGQTALRAAAGRGHLGVVQFLLDHDADVDARSGDGRTALEAATEGGYLEIVARFT